eukprot:236166-Chlamydomonas_euryale.AAC.3
MPAPQLDLDPASSLKPRGLGGLMSAVKNGAARPVWPAALDCGAAPAGASVPQMPAASGQLPAGSAQAVAVSAVQPHSVGTSNIRLGDGAALAAPPAPRA